MGGMTSCIFDQITDSRAPLTDHRGRSAPSCPSDMHHPVQALTVGRALNHPQDLIDRYTDVVGILQRISKSHPGKLPFDIALHRFFGRTLKIGRKCAVHRLREVARFVFLHE